MKLQPLCNGIVRTRHARDLFRAAAPMSATQTGNKTSRDVVSMA
jgi:hypothetical protein